MYAQPMPHETTPKMTSFAGSPSELSMMSGPPESPWQASFPGVFVQTMSGKIQSL